MKFFHNIKVINMKNKGKWLPKEGRYKNLEMGQWDFPSWECKIFGHDFRDPRVFNRHKPQKWEKCIRCGKEQKL